MGHILSLFPKLALVHTLSTAGVSYFPGIFPTARALMRMGWTDGTDSVTDKICPVLSD